MSQSAITRPDSLGILRTRCDRRCEPVGPTPIYEHVARELERIATVWGTASRGWTCRYDATGCVLSAYVGKPSNVVACVHNIDCREGLKQLLASLFECEGT